MTAQSVAPAPPTTADLSTAALGPSRSPLTHLVVQLHVEAIHGATDPGLVHTATTEIERFCRFYLIKHRHGASSHDRDDIVQDSLIKVWKSIKSFDPTAPAEPWISRIASNCAIDFWRRKAAIKEICQSTLPVDDFEVVATAATDAGAQEPSRGMIEAESEVRAQRIKEDFFKNLPPLLRETVELKLAGLQLNQIAHEQEIPANTVKSRLRAARRRIEEVLKESEAM